MLSNGGADGALAGAPESPLEALEARRFEERMGHPEPSRSLRFPLGNLPTEPFAARGRWAAAVAVAGVCAALAFAPVPPWVATAGFTAVLLVALFTRRALLAAARRPVGYLVLDERGAYREGPGGREPIVRAGEPFGLTLLAGRARGRMLLAFTTRDRTRYVPVERGGEAAVNRLPLASRAIALPDEDLAPVGDDAPLAEPCAVELVEHIARRWPDALERIYLTTARGEPVELEGRVLRAGERTLDLAMPLDCRSYCFHESGGRVTTLYQATWVRQGDAEVALVAPQPGEPTAAGEPPPREIRFAVDRLFMVPLRRALERAPRASRPNPSGARSLEGRA